MITIQQFSYSYNVKCMTVVHNILNKKELITIYKISEALVTPINPYHKLYYEHNNEINIVSGTQAVAISMRVKMKCLID